MDKTFELTLENIEQVAIEIINALGANKLVAFSGSMGAGKTTLITAICRELGTQDNVASPTFSIINEYLLNDGGSIFHFDFYRLKDTEEALNIGFEDYVYSGNWCLMEWPEKVVDILPDNLVLVNITEENPRTRKVEVKFN